MTQPASGKGKPYRSLWRARDGATAVEMAFLLPVFMMFLLGIVELGRLLWTQTSLQFAVEAAARCAAVSPTVCTPDVQHYAAHQVYGMTIPATAFTYTPNATCGVASGASQSGGAQVTANYSFQTVVPHMLPFNITLNAKSCHP